MAPSINLAVEETEAVLDEIVERSGLLIVVGGQRYQFAHLTIQEHFAALALAARPDALMDRVERDPARWRESARLWCGLAPDSSAVIERLLASQPLIALECLADAAQVERSLADRVLETMRPELGRDLDGRDEVARAFGAVASSPRARGREVLRWLIEELRRTRQRAVVIALSESHLEVAARALCRHAHLLPFALVEAAIIDMGDVAVPALTSAVEEGHALSVARLTAIGTPTAALGLAQGMWASDNKVAAQAAWGLASLIRDPAIEATLAIPPDVGAQVSGWASAPFHAVPRAARPVVERMMALVAMTASSPAPFAPIDDRVAVGVTLVEFQPSTHPYGRAISWDDGLPGALRARLSPSRVGQSFLVEQDEAAAGVRSLLAGRRVGDHPEEVQQLSRWALACLSAFSRVRGVLEATRPELQPMLVAAFLGGTGTYTPQRFAELSSPPVEPVSAMRSRFAIPYVITVAVLLVASGAAVLGARLPGGIELPTWSRVATGVVLGSGLLSMATLARNGHVEQAAQLPIASLAFGPTMATDPEWRRDWLLVPVLLATPLTLVLLSAFLVLCATSLRAYALGIAAVAASTLCLYRGQVLQRRSRNPFVSLLFDAGSDD